MRALGIATMAVLAMAAPVSPHQRELNSKRPPVPSVSPSSAEATVNAFHLALSRGDMGSAAALLAEDALIFESGAVERNKAEYASKHLGADSEFARSVTTLVTRRSAKTVGSIAWVGSEGRATGTFKGKAINGATAETMILRRAGPSWKIIHIHWSSAPSDDRAISTD